MKKLRSVFQNKTKVRKILWSLLTGGLFGLISFYLFLPPINPRAAGFWVWVFFLILAFSLPFLKGTLRLVWQDSARSRNRQRAASGFSMNGGFLLSGVRSVMVPLIALAVPVAVLILGSIFSSPLFHARAYAAIISVNEADFAADMPETNEITNIALMDSESATIIGNRKLGELSDVVSQYVVAPHYVQINYRDTPKKVAPLEYDGFFKWLQNRSAGVPGMVMVDPVKSSASYMKFSSSMKYVESAYFGEKLERKLRFSYPTKIFGSVSFEADDEGNPHYIVACLAPRVFLFGGYDVSEVIVFDPESGESELYPVEQTPSWIDIVYTGQLACKKYDWYGELQGGFINSLIGQRGCKRTTSDFGYIVRDDDVWYFTGVTSVTSDESNIGFILSNARTGAYQYYPVNGAEEYSAMSAAEGEVQEKGYRASFPSLINYAGQPTYIMVLKDSAGLVKLYALVNVENYSIVATGDDQPTVMNQYKKLLLKSGKTAAAEETVQTATVTVSRITQATVGGSTVFYFHADDGNAYKGFLETDESLVLITEGDRMRFTYSATDVEGIRLIVFHAPDVGVEGPIIDLP